MTTEASKTKLILGILGTVLILNSALAFFVVLRAKKENAPHVECAQKRWGWTHALEQLEWNLRRWEMMAPKCVQAGMPLAVNLGGSSEYEVQQLESVRPVIARSIAPTVIVTSNHMFRSGATVWLCGNHAYFKARISGTISSGKKRTLMHLQFEGEKRPTELTTDMVVVASNPARYSLVHSRGGAGSILTVKQFMQAAAPIAVGVDSFSINLKRANQASTQVHLALNAKKCQLAHDFLMKNSSPGANRGIWVLKEEVLVFNPWVVSIPSPEIK